MIIKAFQTDRGENIIKTWIDSQPKKAKAEIKTRLRYLAIQNIWSMPLVKKLKGSKYIFEIRIKKDNVQYRPLGFYGPGQNEFTFVAGAIEKGSKLQPATSKELAELRRNKILKDESYATRYFI